MTNAKETLRAWRRILAETTTGLCEDAAAAIDAAALAFVAPLANPTETEIRFALTFARDAWVVDAAAEVQF